MPKDRAALMELKRWIASLPRSRMHYPETWLGYAKYTFWRLYTPFHSFFRDFFLHLRVLKHEGRQNFLLGRVAPHTSIQEVITHLITRGYGNHFVAWRDDGELVSLRYAPNFVYQYHIRIFEDGEVRAHYEYTPESHPYWHLQEVGIEERREEFLALLEGHVEFISAR